MFDTPKPREKEQMCSFPVMQLFRQSIRKQQKHADSASELQLVFTSNI